MAKTGSRWVEIRERQRGMGEFGDAGDPGTVPVAAGGVDPSVEPAARRGQAAFGNVSLTVLKLSTTMSLSSEPVSR